MGRNSRLGRGRGGAGEEGRVRPQAHRIAPFRLCQGWKRKRREEGGDQVEPKTSPQVAQSEPGGTERQRKPFGWAPASPGVEWTRFRSSANFARRFLAKQLPRLARPPPRRFVATHSKQTHFQLSYRHHLLGAEGLRILRGSRSPRLVPHRARLHGTEGKPSRLFLGCHRSHEHRPGFSSSSPLFGVFLTQTRREQNS